MGVENAAFSRSINSGKPLWKTSPLPELRGLCQSHLCLCTTASERQVVVHRETTFRGRVSQTLTVKLNYVWQPGQNCGANMRITAHDLVVIGGSLASIPKHNIRANYTLPC